MRKFSCILLTAAMVMTLFTGCASDYVTTTEAPAPATTAAEKSTSAAGSEADVTTAAPSQSAADIKGTELEVWYAISGNSGELFEKQSNAFADASGVKLSLNYTGGSADTATKVSAAMLSKELPDVALMYAGPLYTGGNGDFSMNELMNDPEFNRADIYEGMLDYCVYMNEGVCAVPYGISTQVMYYNKDILAAAGVDMTNPPKTWAEFAEVCKTVLEKGNINNSPDFTAFDTTDAPWLFKSMLMQNGCEIVENNDGKITPIFNNEKAVEVADYWKSLVDSGAMAVGQHANAEKTFQAGNLAFVAASSNRVSRWNGTTSFGLGAIEMPYFNEPSLALGGNVLVIFTQDPVKQAAAWEYVKYLTNEANETEFALSTGYLPIRKSAMESDAVKQAIAENEMYNVAFNQLSYTWAYTHFEEMGTMDSLLTSMLGNLEKGRGTSQELLNKAVSSLEKEIAEDQANK